MTELVTAPPNTEQNELVEDDGLNDGLKNLREMTIKVGTSDHLTIRTLQGIRASTVSSNAPELMSNAKKQRELSFQAYRDIDTQRAYMFEGKTTLPVNQMIRRDNAIQRHLVDDVLGKEQRYYRDPRPLAQQFQEMNPVQMVRKMVELELDEKILALGPQRASRRERERQINADRVEVPFKPSTYKIPLPTADEVGLIHWRRDATAFRINDEGVRPLDIPSSVRKPKRLTEEERLARLLTPQARAVLNERQGCKEYDRQVEKTVADAVTQQRRKAVLESKNRWRALQQQELAISEAVSGEGVSDSRGDDASTIFTARSSSATPSVGRATSASRSRPGSAAVGRVSTGGAAAGANGGGSIRSASPLPKHPGRPASAAAYRSRPKGIISISSAALKKASEATAAACIGATALRSATSALSAAVSLRPTHLGNPFEYPPEAMRSDFGRLRGIANRVTEIRVNNRHRIGKADEVEVLREDLTAVQVSQQFNQSHNTSLNPLMSSSLSKSGMDQPLHETQMMNDLSSSMAGSPVGRPKSAKLRIFEELDVHRSLRLNNSNLEFAEVFRDGDVF